MGFEYKNDLKELLPEYLDYLVSKGEIEERGDGFYTCPFCNSGNKQKNTAAFHVKGTRYQCFSCTKKGDIFDLVGHMEGLENDFAKHYNRALKIMRPYLNGDKKETYELKVLNKKNNPFVWIYGIFKLQHLRKI